MLYAAPWFRDYAVYGFRSTLAEMGPALVADALRSGATRHEDGRADCLRASPRAAPGLAHGPWIALGVARHG
jgi:hypothetical protein